MNKMNIKRYGLLLTASIVLATASCSKQEEFDTDVNQNQGGALTETLKLNIDTKVTLSDALEAAWEDGDQIAVWTGTSETEGQFQTCRISSNSIVVSFADETYHRYNYAVHYCGKTLPEYSEGTLTVTLPDEYNYAEVSSTKNPVPMVAKSLYTEGSTLSFYSVGALARIKLDGIPAATKYIDVTFDKDVTGTFVVSGLGTEAPYISSSDVTDKNVVRVTLPAYTTNYDQYIDAYLNLPIPQGTVSVSSVVTYDNAGNRLATNTGGAVISGWNALRTRAKKATASFAPSFHNLIIAPGNFYTKNGEMKISDNAYTNIYNGTKTFTDTPDDYSPNDRTIFTWNELYVMLNTGLMPTYEQATDNQHGVDMSTMTFEALGKTWHVGTVDEYLSIFGLNGSPQRPGATVNITKPDGTAQKPQSRWVKLTIEETTVENSTAALRGVLVFPDNKTINITFETYKGNLDGNSTGNKFPDKSISFEILNDLITNQGCAFLPAVGNYKFATNAYDNMETAASIATATENPDNDEQFKWWNMQTTNLSMANHPGFLDKANARAVSVRMLRPVE